MCAFSPLARAHLCLTSQRFSALALQRFFILKSTTRPALQAVHPTIVSQPCAAQHRVSQMRHDDDDDIRVSTTHHFTTPERLSNRRRAVALSFHAVPPPPPHILKSWIYYYVPYSTSGSISSQHHLHPLAVAALSADIWAV